jgi:hypothetical protein
MTEDIAKLWSDKAAKALVGKTIVKAEYLSKDEAWHAMGWHSRCIVLILNDGTALFPSADDEGNEAGALFTTIPDLETIPVIG